MRLEKPLLTSTTGSTSFINQIRTVLGDNADHPLYIETLPRRGYRFVAPVISKTIPAPQARIMESESGKRNRLLVLIGGRTQGIRRRSGRGGQRASSCARCDHQRQEPLTAARTCSEARSRWSQIPACPDRSGGAASWAVGGGLYSRWRAHKVPVLTEKDTIVLADFENTTGDPVFDDTLKQGLAIQLEQSPFLNVLSDRKVAGTLKLMDRSATEPLDRGSRPRGLPADQ